MAAILELLFEDDPGAPIVVIVSSLFGPSLYPRPKGHSLYPRPKGQIISQRESLAED